MRSKSDLRTFYKELRNQLTADQVSDLSLDIANHSLKLNIWNKQMYHVFLSITEFKEVQTDFVLHVLQGKDKNIVVAKSDFSDYSMSHFLLTDQTILVKNKHNIPEPAGEGLIPIDPQQIDVVFVPLLVADIEGNRVGYGKGFYDRFLAQCRPDVLKIGLSFFEPLSELIEHNAQDISLNYLVTPQGVVGF
jgi:5-formyltetrahydrofolate cyclo-ligase